MASEEFSFLVCSERSGSNLMTQVLDGHSEVSGPSPIHLLRVFVPLEHEYERLGEGGWAALARDVERLFRAKIGYWEASVRKGEVAEAEGRSVAECFRLLYRKEAQARGKRRSFVKENHAYRLVPYLTRNFPGAKLVWVHRDPRDMALSWKRSPILRGEVVRAARVWKEDQKATLFLYRYLRRHGDMIRLSYEDLIGSPEQSTWRVCRFLGLQFEKEMLALGDSPRRRADAGASVGWENLGKEIVKNNKQKYRIGLTKEEIQFVEYWCGEEMKVLGYELEHDVVSRKEAAEIECALALEERYVKEEYEAVSSAEREKRMKWSECVQQVQSAFGDLSAEDS